MNLRCLFCGTELQAQGESPRRWGCPRCRSLFSAELDRDGCVVGLKVEGCGAEDCCRDRKQDGG